MSSNGHLSMCVLPSFPLCTCHPFACEGYITLCVSSFQTFCEFPLQGHGQSQESGGHLWVPHESCLTVRWIPPLQLPATHTQLQPVAGKFISLLCTVTHLPSTNCSSPSGIRKWGDIEEVPEGFGRGQEHSESVREGRRGMLPRAQGWECLV